MLHPVKLVLAWLLETPYQLDSYFLIFHLALLFLATYFAGHYFAKNTITNASSNEIIAIRVASLFGASSITFGTATYTGFGHPFFICSVAYGTLMLIVADQFISKPNTRSFVFMTFLTALMLLSGNFAMQWLCLLLISLYSVSKIIVESKPYKNLIFVGFSVALGFLLAGPQIAQTFELMQFTHRSDFGALTMLHQSTGPFQWLSYLSPAPAFMLVKYGGGVFSSVGGNNLAEGVHYLGIIPLALLLAQWISNSRPNSFLIIFSVCLVFFVLRALGVFSPINILLNHLPFFGQFRFPIRTLFLIDVTLVLMATIYLAGNVDRKSLTKSLKFACSLIFVIVLTTVIIICARALFRGVWPSISGFEILYLFAGLLIALAALWIVAKAQLSVHGLRFWLVLLSLIDVGFHLTDTPTYWRSELVTEVSARANDLDALCTHANVKHTYLNSNSIWSEFNLPEFKFGDKPQGRYITASDTTPDPNGNKCSLSYSLNISTLTPDAVIDVQNWLDSFGDLNKRQQALKIIGYDAVARTTGNVGRGSVAEEIYLTSSDYVSASVISSFKNDLLKDRQRSRVSHGMEVAIFNLLDQIDMVSYLATTQRHPFSIDGVGRVIYLPPPILS